MNFLDLISVFTDTPKEKIGVYVIHVDSAIERLPLMNKFNTDIRVIPKIISAENGNELIKNGHPCIATLGNPQQQGAVSCTRSHLRACETALKEGKEYCVIFEDDVIFNKNFNDLSQTLLGIKQFFNTYAIKYDMFLLGALGYPSFFPNNIGISSIYAFDGAHAMILSKKAIKAYIDFYYNCLMKNIIEPSDGIYTYMLRNGIIGIGFTNAKEYFDQKQDGMWSYVGDLQK